MPDALRPYRRLLEGWLPHARLDAPGDRLFDAYLTWKGPHGVVHYAVEEKRTLPTQDVRGVPVIASAAGGLAEVVEEGASGLFFPNNDREALFDRLREVAVRHDARLRSQLTDDETAQLADLLDRLQAGVEHAEPEPTAPRVG